MVKFFITSRNKFYSIARLKKANIIFKNRKTFFKAGIGDQEMVELSCVAVSERLRCAAVTNAVGRRREGATHATCADYCAAQQLGCAAVRASHGDFFRPFFFARRGFFKIKVERNS